MSQKVRIYELSKSLDVTNKDVMDVLEQEFGIVPKSHSSSIDQSVAKKVTEILKKGKGTASSGPSTAAAKPAESTTVISGPAIPGIPGNARIRIITKEELEEEKRVAEEEEEKNPRIRLIPRPLPKREPQPQPQPQSQAPVTEPETPVEKAEPSEPHPSDEGKLIPRPRPKLEMPGRPAASDKPDAPAASAGRVEAALPTIGIRKVERPDGPRREEAVGDAPRKLEPSEEERKKDKKGKEKEAIFDDGPRKKPNTVPPSLKKMASMVGAGPGKKSPTRKGPPPRVREREEDKEPETFTVTIDDKMTVADLAAMLKRRETEIIKTVFMKGMMVTVNQTLDPTFARTIARELGFEVLETEKQDDSIEYSTTDAVDKKSKALSEKQYKHLRPRWPVVSIMGHVDHGKTSLLDSIRQVRHKIVDTEAGGITQSIGAYTVEKDDHRIVFLDTPGHEAFTAMRMRGARSTDIAVLVVAADDGVMPQTIEAINHAKAAEIPIIVAVNKIDKPDADPDRVLGQLMEYGLNPEDWGGDTQVAQVSALKKLNLDDLLDKILLVSELLELKADPTVAAEGVIVEAQLDKQRGPLATALVQNGTLRVGENILIGAVGGRVRALISDTGERLKEAGPSTPVEILGLNGVPNAGDRFQVVQNDKEFKRLLAEEKSNEREQRLDRRLIMPGLRAPSAGDDEIEEQYMNFIVKADTQGSAEAVNDALSALSNDEIKVKILHSGTGNISDADVMLASASDAIIIGFNTTPDSNAAASAERAGVRIREYDVIYHMSEEIEKIMLGQLSPEVEEVEIGRAEVRELFKAGKNVIAGCMVQDGKITRNAKVQLFRNNKVIFKGSVAALKRFKDDVKEVASGFECGITLNGFNDFEPGDIMAFMVTEEKERTADTIKRSSATA